MCITWGPECQNILQEVGLLVGIGNSIIGSISSPSLYFGKFPIGKLYKSGTIQTFLYGVYEHSRKLMWESLYIQPVKICKLEKAIKSSI